MTETRKAMPIQPVSLQLAQHRRNVWSIIVQENVGISDILKPEFWAHVAERLKSRDRIEVMAIDNSFYAELFVLNTGNQWAAVDLLVEKRFISEEEAGELSVHEKAQDFYIKFCGPVAKWCVLRKSDKASMKTQFEVKPEAEKWLLENADKIS